MQAFNHGPIARRPKRVPAPDASLAREAALRCARASRLAHRRSRGARGMSMPAGALGYLASKTAAMTSRRGPPSRQECGMSWFLVKAGLRRRLN